MGDQLKQIEDMLAKGMTEDQIIAELSKQAGTASAANSAPLSFGQLLSKATSIGPAPARWDPSGWPSFIREMLTGIKHPLDMDSQELSGSVGIPFTDLRIGVGDATAGILGGGIAAKVGEAGIPRAIGALMERLPSRRAMNVNNWANEMFPSRLTDPRRLLGPGDPPIPDFPHGYIDDIPLTTPDHPPGFTDFIPQETVETKVMGTMPPINLKSTQTQQAALQQSLRPKPKPKVRSSSLKRSKSSGNSSIPELNK